MRPTDPRENLYPVLPPETYRRLGIPMPRPRQSYGSGGPVSASGTPYLTGHAVTGSGGAGSVVTPNPVPPPANPAAPPLPPAPPGYPMGPPAPAPRQQSRAVWIVVATTALVVAIIIGTTWYILASRTSDDEQQIRSVIAAENEAVNSRDLDALVKTRCLADVQQLQLRFTPQTFAAEVDTLLGPGGTWKVTVLSVAIDKDAGTATAEETTEPIGQTVALPQTVTDTAYLRKESGAWKVCISSSAFR